MKDLSARTGVSLRLLRAAARLILCLALVLLPAAGASAAHFETGISAAHGHDGNAGAPATGDHAPLCHQLGACNAFVAPSVPDVAREHAPPAMAIAAASVPANAAQHRLFRPPIAGARA
ncbi:MAG TPA: hypothetical protein VIF14_12255 [Alphaproteobacteria bacterium]